MMGGWEWIQLADSHKKTWKIQFRINLKSNTGQWFHWLSHCIWHSDPLNLRCHTVINNWYQSTINNYYYSYYIFQNGKFLFIHNNYIIIKMLSNPRFTIHTIQNAIINKYTYKLINKRINDKLKIHKFQTTFQSKPNKIRQVNMNDERSEVFIISWNKLFG